MLIQEIIGIKRDKGILSQSAIQEFICAVTDGSASEGQIAAFAMAVLLNGMERSETVALTEAMRDSGTVLSWPELNGPIVDKHSTGGVGDNVSLILAPIIAACGAFVPMISGRGLGHTGGTLDKMEAIPGYQAQPDEALFRRVVKQAGCAIIGQTDGLAPADKRLYAVRDITATVESVPLITGSILSKKLAAGLDALVLDVKCGNGAFMNDRGKARVLAKSLVEVAKGAGLNATAILTDMNEPLASAAGNALEVHNAVDFLTGKHRDPRLTDVILNLAAAMLVQSTLAKDLADGVAQAQKVLDNGKATEHFSKMVHALGGPADFVEKNGHYLQQAPIIEDICVAESGFITASHARKIGIAVIGLGGGRRVASDEIDHAVGFDLIAPIGTKIDKGDVIGRVHAKTQSDANIARQEFLSAVLIEGKKANPVDVILERIVT